MNYYEAVKHFHVVFGHPAPNHITLSPYEDEAKDEQLRALRFELIREEVEELEDALADKDIVEIADAGADVLYTAFGAQVAFGLPQTIIGLDSPRKHKIASYQTEALTLVEAIKDALTSLKEATANMDVDGVNDALTNIIYHTLVLTNECGIDMDAVFAEVQRSNMSKLDPDTGLPVLREDGKIMKGRAYSRPDIAKILAQQIDAD